MATDLNAIPTEPPFPKLGKIVIRVENVWGQYKIYPVCERSKLIAELAGTKTLTNATLCLAERLGFEILADNNGAALLEKARKS